MKSIAHQIALTALIVLTISVAAASAGVYFGVRAMMHHQLDQTLESHALALASLTNIDEDIIEFEYSADRNSLFEGDESEAHFQLWVDTSTGTSLTWSARSQLDPIITHPETQPPDSALYWDMPLPDGRPGRAVSLRFELEHENLDDEDHDTDPHQLEPIDSAAGLVVVVVTKEPMLQTTAAVRWWLLAMGAMLAFIIPLVILLSVRHGLRPLHQMNREIRSIDAHSLDARLDIAHMPTELVDSAHRINDLLARLAEAFAKEKRFTAAAAHELRTPLAEIRTIAEVALRENQTGSAAPALKEVVDASAEVESLLVQLLSIARGQSPRTQHSTTEFNIVDTINAAAANHRSALEENQIRLKINAPDLLTIKSNHEVVTCIINNLISNIARYATPNTDATITCCRAHDAIEIRFSNTTESPDESLVQRIFEPFWQADPSRSAGSFGMGLAVAQTLAQSLPSTLSAHIDAATKQLILVLQIPNPEIQVPSG